MQITAKLTQLPPLQSGTGKSGEWKKQDIILETDGQYPKKVCISIWGEKINESQLKIGNLLKIDFDLESREYNGRWYTDIKAWKIEVIEANKNNQSESANSNPNHNLDTGKNILPDLNGNDDDVLPF